METSKEMKPEYLEWIRTNYPTYESCYGYCKEACEKMLLEFPELTLQRGHYYCYSWGERMHWWLTDADGKEVDPTAKQFPSKGAGVYIIWDESQPEPIGQCPNCGELCYDGNYCCTERCHNAFVASL